MNGPHIGRVAALFTEALWCGSALPPAPVRAQADDEPGGLVLMNERSAQAKLEGARLPRRGAQAGVAPETTFVGHVSAGAAYDYGSYHIGTGPFRLTQGPANVPNPLSNWNA